MANRMNDEKRTCDGQCASCKDNAVNKLEKMTDEQFELLDLIPDFDE